MRIQYNKSDPRAGMTVEVPGELGKKLIRDGAASEVKANTPATPATASDEHKAITRAAADSAKKAPAKQAAKKAAGKGR